MTALCSFICNCPKLVINEMFTKGWMKNQTVIYPYNWTLCCCFAVMQSCSTLCVPMDCSTPGCPVLHHLPELVQTHVYWASDAIQPSYPLLPTFFSCPQSFLASGSFPMSQLFTSSGQSIGASASASILPKNIHGWFPLRLTDLISLQSKGLSSVFSSTTIRKHQFFTAQPSLWSNFHIHTWLPKKT